MATAVGLASGVVFGNLRQAQLEDREQLSTAIVRSGPKNIYNTIADVAGSRKGLDKLGKLVVNATRLFDCACSYVPSAAPVGSGVRSFGDFVGGVRSFIKLFDVLDDCRHPGSLEAGPLANHIVMMTGFGVADTLSIVTYLDDAGIIDLGEAGEYVSHVGSGFAFMGLTANLVKQSIDLTNSAAAISAARVRLQDLYDGVVADLGYVADDDGNFTEDQMQEIEARLNTIEVRSLQDGIAKAESSQVRSWVDIAQTILDIVGLVFAFVAALVVLPFGITAPILSVLGIGAAGAGLAKLWIDNSAETKVSQFVYEQDDQGALVVGADRGFLGFNGTHGFTMPEADSSSD